MKRLIIITALCLFSGNYFSQNSNSKLVQVPDLIFKKDTGATYTLYFSAKYQHIENLLSTKIDFLDHNNKEVGTLGLFNAKQHEKGFYYIESSSHNKIVFNGGGFELVLKRDGDQYAAYKKIKITYTSLNGLAEHFLFTITKP